MRDRPLLRLSRLLSMDSHPSLPRPSVCGSLEPTTLLMKPVAWFSTCVFPSRGVICAFSQQCSPYSDVFCPTRSMALLTFPLFLPPCCHLVAHPVGIKFLLLRSRRSCAFHLSEGSKFYLSDGV